MLKHDYICHSFKQPNLSLGSISLKWVSTCWHSGFSRFTTVGFREKTSFSVASRGCLYSVPLVLFLCHPSQQHQAKSFLHCHALLQISPSPPQTLTIPLGPPNVIEDDLHPNSTCNFKASFPCLETYFTSSRDFGGPLFLSRRLQRTLTSAL